MSDEVVSISGLSKTYMRGKVPVQALTDVNMVLHRGEFASIMGPSGSGKSTLLQLIGCLDRPTQGNIVINGVDVVKAKNSELPRIRREQIGFVFQHFNLLPALTALGNVEMAMRFSRVPKKERLRRAEELLRQMGLGDRLHHRPAELSGGEQQRVSIARALANRPAVILADEPTGEVDSRTRDMIIGILASLSEQGNTVIVVTHDPAVAEKTARRIVMRDGSIISDSAAAGA